MNNWREEYKSAQVIVMAILSTQKIRGDQVVTQLRTLGWREETAKRAIWYLLYDGSVVMHHDRTLEISG